MDDDLKRKALRRLAKKLPEKHNAWQSGAGHINMHATHPLADIKPREQFLISLDKTVPEVKAELDVLSHLFQRARKTADDWGDIKYAARHPERVTAKQAEIFEELCRELGAWGNRWNLEEGHWEGDPTWLLDWAVSYLAVAPQASLAFTTMDNGFEEHLTKQERRTVFTFNETIPQYALGPKFKGEYIESTLREWRKELESRLSMFEGLLDEKLGAVAKKRTPVHFDWLVLRHVLGHSADTISTAHAFVKPSLTEEAVRKGIKGAAELSGLTLQPLQTGPVDSQAKEEAVQDVARRLHLP